MPTEFEIKEACIKAIADHLMFDDGSETWIEILAKFPTVNERTFHRWVAGVKSGELAPEEMKAEGQRRARALLDKNLPAIPSPQYLAAGGPKIVDDMNVLAMVRLVYSDLMLGRENAFYPDDYSDPEKAGKVKNNEMLIRNALARLKACQTTVQVIERAWDIQYITNYLNGVADIVLECVSDPIERGEITRRIRMLNDRHNMTLNERGAPPL